MARAKLNKVAVRLPWLGLEGEIVADDNQRRAAWELYVELITRIAVQPLAPDEGLVREALSSLYALFGETRRILRDYGPEIAIVDKKKYISLGQLAVDVLNHGLRPFLAKWHPLLQEHESRRPAGSCAAEHERQWALHDELRRELEAKREQLAEYADVLVHLCEVSSLHSR